MSPAPVAADAPDARTHAAEAARGAAHKRAYVRGMFSAIAPRYDLLNRVLSFAVDRGWRRRAIAALALERVPDGRVLDLCAGTLDVAAEILRTPGFAGRVVGADFAVPMLAHGRKKGPAGRLAPVGADALRLPFADGTFDAAIVAFGVRNLADLDAGFAEVRRVCRPGARFAVLEFSTPPNPFVRAAYHAYSHHVLPRIGAWVSGHATAYGYLPASVAQFPGPEALTTRLRAAGWADVTWRPLTFGVAALHVGVRP